MNSITTEPLQLLSGQAPDPAPLQLSSGQAPDPAPLQLSLGQAPTLDFTLLPIRT